MHGCSDWQSAVLDSLHDVVCYFLDHGDIVLNLDSFGPRGNSGGTVCQGFARLADAGDYRTYGAIDVPRYLKARKFVDSRQHFPDAAEQWRRPCHQGSGAFRPARLPSGRRLLSLVWRLSRGSGWPCR